MKLKFLYITLSLLIISMLVSVSAQQEKPRIVVLANSIDFELASNFFGFFNPMIEVVHATASDFDQYKGEKFIVILGGPDAYEGVGEIVREVLEDEEEDYLRVNGNRNRYVKTNTWSQGQEVTVLAGYCRHQTQKAHEEHIHVVRQDAQRVLQVPLTVTPPPYTPPPPPKLREEE
jgi:hypothetical protein